MKENKYDDEVFFDKYSRMERSKKGLEAAGEWATLRSLLPDFKGRSVLDLGCGYGWHCRYASERGAERVVGVDLSQKMIEKARAMTCDPEIEYICRAVEDVDYPSRSFDIVISSLALHYVEDYKSVIRVIYRMLKKGGNFVFSAEHPIFTAEGSEDWIRDSAGRIKCFPVDNYFSEGQRITDFLGEPVLKYHRTLTTYINELIAAGFKLQAVVEPQPAPAMLKDYPEMADELRRPMMLIVSAVK